jgi:hypothetical protein
MLKLPILTENLRCCLGLFSAKFKKRKTGFVVSKICDPFDINKVVISIENEELIIDEENVNILITMLKKSIS